MISLLKYDENLGREILGNDVSRDYFNLIL